MTMETSCLNVLCFHMQLVLKREETEGGREGGRGWARKIREEKEDKVGQESA